MLADLQNAKDRRGIDIDQVGVSNVRYPLTLPLRSGEAGVDQHRAKPIDAVLVRDLSGQLHRIGGESSSPATVGPG